MSDIVDVFQIQIQSTEQVTATLQEIAKEASKGVTVGVKMDADVTNVLKAIEKVADAMQSKVANGSFDFNDLFNLKDSIAKLGELSSKFKDLAPIFNSLNSGANALGTSMTQIASLKLEAGQFQKLQTSLNNIDQTISNIAHKLGAVNNTGAFNGVEQGAKEAAAEIDRAAQATGELEKKQKDLANAAPTKTKTGVVGANQTNSNQQNNGLKEQLNTLELTEDSLKEIIELFKRMEASLSAMKKVFVDIGDGDEFSPLMSAIEKINASINTLNNSTKNIGLNMNISADSATQLDRDFEDKASKALIAYQRLFEHIKMSGAGGTINDAFFNFDLNAFDTTVGKIRALYNFIEKARQDAKQLYSGKDVLKLNTDSKYWNEASAALRQMSIVQNKMNDAGNTSALDNLFQKTDLTEVVSQLGLIATKLDKISATALEFKNSFKEGLNFKPSLTEIDNLTNKIKGLDTELSKFKLANKGVSVNAVVTGDGGQLALESTLKATYEIQQKMAQTLTEINTQMSAGAEKAIPIYDKLHSSILAVVTAIESMNTAGGTSTQTIDMTNVHIQELEAKLEAVTQKYAALEDRMKKAKSSKSENTSADAVTQKTEEQIAIEQKAAEIMKLSAEARIRIQENLQKQITKTVSLIGTEYDKIREMYQYINDFAYQTNGKKDAFNKAMNAKRDLTAFNKSGSDDDIQRAKLEYTYQRFYDDLVTRIGKSQSHNDSKMLSQLGNVKTSATMAENEAIIRREIELTAELIQKNKELIATKQGQGENNKAALARINEIETLKKQYDSYIAKKKTVEDLQNKRQTLLDESADEQKIINVNRQLDLALDKLAKAEAFIQRAFANDPVGAQIVSIKELNTELERKNNLTASSKSQSTTSVTKSMYNPVSNVLRNASNHGALIDTQEGQYIQNLIDKFKEYDQWIAKVGNHFEQLSNTQQSEILESIDDFNRLTATQKDALKAGEYHQYNAKGRLQGSFVGFDESQIASIKSLTAGSAEYTAALTDILNNQYKIELENVKLDQSYKQLTGTYRDSNGNLQQMTATLQDNVSGLRVMRREAEAHKGIVKSVFEPFGNKLKEIFRYFSAYTIVMRFFNAFKQGITYVRELNTALTEMQLVTESTADEMARIEKEIQKVAASVASTNVDIAQSATDWAKLGYSMSDALELAGVSAQYAKVGFTDVATASENLTATMQAFYSKELSQGLLDAGDLAESITDKFVDVGNKFASSAEGLGRGMTAAGSALVAANNSLDESLALITAGTTILQDENETANAIRTISLRLRGTKSSELEDLGETDLTGVIEDASKLYAQIKKLTSVNGGKGVEIINTDTGAYKSTYEILLDIAKVWDEMDDFQQAGLLETIAGKTRANAAAAILSNGEILEDAYNASIEAAGATAEAMETTMTSIESRITLFNQAVQTMWQNEMSSDFIKGFVDLGTVFVKLIDKAGLLSTALAGIMGVMGAKGQGRHTKQRVLIKYA